MSSSITDAGEDEMRAELKVLDKLNEDIDQLSSDARDCTTLAPSRQGCSGSGVVLRGRRAPRRGPQLVRTPVQTGGGFLPVLPSLRATAGEG